MSSEILTAMAYRANGVEAPRIVEIEVPVLVGGQVISSLYIQSGIETAGLPEILKNLDLPRYEEIAHNFINLDIPKVVSVGVMSGIVCAYTGILVGRAIMGSRRNIVSDSISVSVGAKVGLVMVNIAFEALHS